MAIARKPLRESARPTLGKLYLQKIKRELTQRTRRTQAKTNKRKGQSRGPGLFSSCFKCIYSELMFDKKSALVLVLFRRSTNNSMASTGESGFSTLRRTQMRARSSLGMSNSSLRVPDR